MSSQAKIDKYFLILLFFALMILPGNLYPAYANAAGSLDRSFNGTGIVTTVIDGSVAAGAAMAIQADGKIVVVGASQRNAHDSMALIRYNPDGSVDQSFGEAGKVITSFSEQWARATSVVVQPDQKIVVAGYTETGEVVGLIIRYNQNGSLDQTFNGTGIVRTDVPTGGWAGIYSVKLQPDGKIVAAGFGGPLSAHAFAVFRYNPDGTPDTTFNLTGQILTIIGNIYDTASALAIQPDGRIVVAGSVQVVDVRGRSQLIFCVVRYNDDGTLDSSFNHSGKATTFIAYHDAAQSVAIQPDGKIIVGGWSYNGSTEDFALARYSPNGTLDRSFNGTGTVTTHVGNSSYCFSLALQGDGKIIAAGRINLFGFQNHSALVRYLPDGSLDTTFNQTGKIITLIGNYSDQVGAVAFQPDGKIVVAGSSADTNGEGRFAVARYNATPSRSPFDYDGDGRSDISVFRSSAAAWYLLQSQAGFAGVSFGSSTDRMVPADYDGDSKTDIAVYRPSEGAWYVLNSGNSTVSSYVFGVAEDLPTPADYDGDGKADLSVFRPSTGTWYRLNSHDGSFFGYQLGQNGDKPALGDFDGDGKADISIFRPMDGSWYRVNSSTGQVAGTQFGTSGDLITPADYDGDGKTDIAVYRPSATAWYRLNSSTGAFAAVVFGAGTDIPAPGDFDGDGKADVCVFRPSDGNWYRLNSSNNAFVAQPFGANGDLPTPAAFRY
jgi:uncharacterized delta-60 repeat protein